MSEQANVALIQGIYESFRKGDIESILNLVDSPVEWITEGPDAIPFAGTHRDRAGVVKFFEGVGGTMDEITIDMEPFAAQGDNVVMSGRYQARITSTGKRLDVPLVHLWTVRNGKIARYQNMSNTAAMAEAYTASSAAAR